ncbi:MAG: O-antigen ligase family protein [Thermodesulfobacteriota bacterium]
MTSQTKSRQLGDSYSFILYTLYVSLIFLTPFIQGPVEVSYFTIIFLAADFILYISILRFLKSGGALYPPSPVYILSLLFLATILLSVVYSIKPSATIYGFMFMTGFVVLGLVLSIYLVPRELFTGLFRILVIVSALLCVMGLFQYFTGTGEMGGRAHSLFVTPNSFAGYLAPIILLLAGIFLISEGKGAKWILILLIILFSVTILATVSRGGWIGLMAGGVFFLYLAGREGLLKWNRWNLILPLSLLLAVLFFAIPLDINKRIASRSGELLTPYTSGSMLDRVRYWKSTIEIIKLHPVRGSGFWTFYHIYPKYKDRALKGSVQFFSHNDYLQFWSEIGVIGLMIFLAIVYVYLKEGDTLLKKRRLGLTDRGGLIGSMSGSVAILVHSMADFNLYIPSIVLIFWSYIGYCLHLKAQSREMETQGILKDRVRSGRSLILITTIIFIALTVFIMMPFLGFLSNEKGIYHTKKNDLERAGLFFKRATGLDPYEANYHSNLSNVYSALALSPGKDKELYLNMSEGEIKRAIKLAPYDSSLYRQLANLYIRFPDFFPDRDVFQVLGKAIEVNPVEPVNYYVLYRAYRSRGFLKEAAAELERYLKDAPYDKRAGRELEGLMKELRP